MSFNNTDLLLEAGNLLSKVKTENDIPEILMKYVNNVLQADLSCFYLKEKSNNNMKLILKRGYQEVPLILHGKSELSVFLSESKELVCLNSRKNSPFNGLLLNNSMKSGMAISIFIKNRELGVIIINSLQPFYFKKKDLSFLENLNSILLHTNLNRSNK